MGEVLTPYIYYITGWSVVNPAMAALAATSTVMLLAAIFNMSWFYYLKRKIERVYLAMFGIGKQLGIDPNEIYTRITEISRGAQGVKI